MRCEYFMTESVWSWTWRTAACPPSVRNEHTRQILRDALKAIHAVPVAEVGETLATYLKRSKEAYDKLRRNIEHATSRSRPLDAKVLLNDENCHDRP